MIIAVNYDDTLLIDGKVNFILIRWLQVEQRKGNIVILWTCREGDSLREALNTLQANGFIPTLVNQNAPSMIRKLGRDPRKIFADIYIDDKGATP